jgi:S-adenosylmethionine synthetase
MIGYACNETATLMPYEYELARHLCQVIYGYFPYDGKVQVTLDGSHIITVVASFQNAPHNELEDLLRRTVKADTYLINPAGDWTLGGLDADSGLSGRKLVVDAYGPNVPIGGGSFSGKDYTKVDRSGAYMARKIAVDLLKYHHSQEVMVKLAYAIGIAEPVMALAIIDGEDHDLLSNNYLDYDLSPQGIRLALGLDNYHFADLSTWGHFGRHDLSAPWC